MPGLPDDMQPLLREVNRTIDQVLNPERDRTTPPRWAYVLVVAPANLEPPVMAELFYNCSVDSVRVVLIEGAARLAGRVSDVAGNG